MLNTDLLLAVREQITSHPESHDQGTWGRKSECGTTHCVAGWAAVLSGMNIWWTDDGKGDLAAMVLIEDETGWAASIPGYAKKALGLTSLQASYLFHEVTEAEAVEYLDILIEAGKNQ